MAQPLQARKGELDPFLWPEVRPAVERATQAELDPTRGAGNAMEILRAERSQLTELRHQTALDLRLAALLLRERFQTANRFDETIRNAQALSTFSKLDLEEPGLKHWLQTCLGSKTPVLRVAVLGRSPSLDVAPFKSEVIRAFQDLPVKLAWVEPAEADFWLKLQVAVQGNVPEQFSRLDIEQVEDGAVKGRKALFRSAPMSKTAQQEQFVWLARIGGRDLLFQFLQKGALPELAQLFSPPKKPHHHHH